jgi:hypothetical protein
MVIKKCRLFLLEMLIMSAKALKNESANHYQDIFCMSGYKVNLVFAGSLFYTTSPQGEMCMMNQSASSAVALLGHVTHVPIKEGLHSVIKCLKNQDLTFSPRESVFYL